jgi:4-amino-4-deoxy-L-arabinose transferase-like glycosyltransferase
MFIASGEEIARFTGRPCADDDSVLKLDDTAWHPVGPARRRRLGLARRGPVLLAILISVMGLTLRIEHAMTFDALHRGADYERHIAGVNWMMNHWRPFYFTSELDLSISYQSPLWYAIAASILKVTGSLRAIAGIAVVGWVIRQILLARLLREAIPHHRWAALIALTIHAFLPISVQTDGEANPEALHSTLFTAAVYALWRMERQASSHAPIGTATAGAFGVLAGLAALTKSTAAILLVTAVVVVGWHARRVVLSRGWRTAWRDVLRPALVAVGAWILVAGWWTGSNLIKYGHPFPHAWTHTFPEELKPLADAPFGYRRPLGWALPFDWGAYWEEPILKGSNVPRPNLWAMMMAGTWSDSINRGFCRSAGGPMHTEYWDRWPISDRCVAIMAAVFRLGCLVAAATVLSMGRAARDHLRADGRQGSLALPLVCVLGVAFPAVFALTYPIDGMAVVNARYLLPVSTAMCACLGMGVGCARWNRLAHALVGSAAAAIAVLVILERWGG